MVSMKAIGLFVGAVTFLTFVAFFGRLPAFRRTPIGFLYRLIWRDTANAFIQADQKVSKGRARRVLSRIKQYLLFEKNPIVLIFFLTLLSGCSYFFLYDGWQYLSSFDRLLLMILLPQPFLFLYLSSLSNASSPHIVTASSHAEQMMQYPYDYKLFRPQIFCSTCQFEKPARSKHCSLCNACIARSDHHCIWINNCVGRGNYKYFLALLLSTAVLLAFGAHLCYKTLKPQVDSSWATHPQWHQSDYQWRTDFVGKFLFKLDQLLDVIGTGMEIGGLNRGAIGLLAFVTCPLPAFLLAYHLYLIWAGVTTNESGKWDDWTYDIKAGLTWVSELSIDTPYYSQSCCSWPKRSFQYMLSTRDGKKPVDVAPRILDLLLLGERAIWTKVAHPKEIDNTYDLGFKGNFLNMLYN